MVCVRVVVGSGRANGVQRWVHEKEADSFALIVIVVMNRNVVVYKTSVKTVSRLQMSVASYTPVSAPRLAVRNHHGLLAPRA